MKTRIAVLVLSCSWAAPSQAADISQSPEDNVRICGSENCIRVAWDYFQWCWFGSGLPRYMRMQALDDLSYETTGVPYYGGGEYWNEPQFVDAKARTNLKNFDLIGSSLYGSEAMPSLVGSNLGSGWGSSAPLAYTAQLGNGVTVEIPATDSGSARYPVEYVKICSLYGAGYYYIPGTDTCIKIGGYVRDTSWFGQGGQPYELQKPKEAPKLDYDYNWSVDATLKYKFDSKSNLTSGIKYDSNYSEERAVDYNKICELNGQGFYYIPGTDTCLKLSGGLAYQEWSPLRSRIATKLADTPEVKTKVEQPKLPDREVFNKDAQPEVKTKVEQPKLPDREVFNKDAQPEVKTKVEQPKLPDREVFNKDAQPEVKTKVEQPKLPDREVFNKDAQPEVKTKVEQPKLPDREVFNKDAQPEVKTKVEQPKLPDREVFNKDAQPEVKTKVEQPKLPDREVFNKDAQPEVKTKVEQPKLPPREVFNNKKGAGETSGKDTKSAPSTKASKHEQKKQAAPLQQAKARLSSVPRWIDAKTGEPVQVGPEGTRTGLFDSNEAFNPETGKSYRKENGVWKDAKTGEVVPERPIHSKVNKDDPNSATHAYNGRQFRFDGGQQPNQPQQPPAAATPPAPAPTGGQWVDAKTGKPVPVGPEGARPGLFDENEAFNPRTGKSYKKENGVWKDRATGKEVPEIPINSQPDANDPGKAKHSHNDRTFTKVSPQTQAETKADGIKKKLEEAKAKLNSHPHLSIEWRQVKSDIELLEKGLDPEEESARFEARHARSEQLIKDLEDIQVPTALSQHKAAKEAYDKEKAGLDMMPKDGPGADAKKRAEQQKKVQQADRNMFDAANRYWKLSADLKRFKVQFEKYREIREPTPEERTKQAEQAQQQIKEFSESRLKAEQAGQRAIDSRYGKLPDQAGKSVGGAKSAEGKSTQSPAGSKGPQTAAKDAPSTPKQAEKAPEPRDETAIRISIHASIWDRDNSGANKPEPFMVNFQPGYTPVLELDAKADIGYEESPSLAIVRNGRGIFDLPYDRRQSLGLTWAKPGSNFLLGMSTPKLSEYVMEAAADAAQIPAQILADDRLPEGAELLRESINVEGRTYVRIGVRERFDMAREWLSGLELAQHYQVDPARFFEDWCWQKLPAYELEPASPTARGEDLPHATLFLSGIDTGSAEQ